MQSLVLTRLVLLLFLSDDCGPKVTKVKDMVGRYLVEEFAAVSADLLGLATDVGGEDGEEAGAVSVLDDESHRHYPGRRHHVGRIL